MSSEEADKPVLVEPFGETASWSDPDGDNGFEQVGRTMHSDDDDQCVTSTSQVEAQISDEPLIVLSQPDASEAVPSFNPQDSLESEEPNFGVTEAATPAAMPQSTVAEPAPSTNQESSEPKPSHNFSVIPESLLNRVDPRVSAPAAEPKAASVFQPVLDLLYWRDVKKTGVVFGSLLVVLLSLALFSVLSVIAYLALAALTVTVSFRVYKNVLGAVQKTGEGHPFKEYLEADIVMPAEKVHEIADTVMNHVFCVFGSLRRLFLVEDMIDSIKFGLLLWVLTYVGSCFNGMTLIILAVVAMFTLPKVYETYQVQIDQYIDLVKTQVQKIVKQVKEKIPLPGKKKEE